MWTWVQRSGRLYTTDGVLFVQGWSGQGTGRNNPDMQDVHGIGPLPCGKYKITQPYTSARTGPYTLGLLPSRDNVMFDRGNFRIHGASLSNPLTSSEGCIILLRVYREDIWESNDEDLLVVKEDKDVYPVGDDPSDSPRSTTV